VFDFIANLEPPVSYAGLWAGGLMLIGLVYLIVLYSTNPQRVRDTGRVFLDEGAPATPPPAP
jgi:hypothetical protein